MNNKIIQLDIPSGLVESIKELIDTYLEKPEVWEPKGGSYFYNPCVDHDDTDKDLLSEFTRQTKEQAEDLAKLLKRTAKLHAWLCENNYLKQWERYDNNYSVLYNDVEWISTCSNIFFETGSVYMTHEGAKATAKALNDGVLVLD